MIPILKYQSKCSFPKNFHYVIFIYVEKLQGILIYVIWNVCIHTAAENWEFFLLDLIKRTLGFLRNNCLWNQQATQDTNYV
jgi:hypothetical protein